MRKILALALLAMLALTASLAITGCGQKSSETTTNESTMPPPEADTSGSMMPDTSMTPDTTMQH